MPYEVIMSRLGKKNPFDSYQLYQPYILAVLITHKCGVFEYYSSVFNSLFSATVKAIINSILLNHIHMQTQTDMRTQPHSCKHRNIFLLKQTARQRSCPVSHARDPEVYSKGIIEQGSIYYF